VRANIIRANGLKLTHFSAKDIALLAEAELERNFALCAVIEGQQSVSVPLFCSATDTRAQATGPQVAAVWVTVHAAAVLIPLIVWGVNGLLTQASLGARPRNRHVWGTRQRL
jgi:hypothetical protein